MIEYADLEIGLHRHDDQSYRLEPSLILPADEASHGLPGSTLLLTEFDRGALNTLLGTNDLTGYGTMLGEKLLPPRLLALLTQGRSGLTNNPPVPLNTGGLSLLAFAGLRG